VTAYADWRFVSSGGFAMDGLRINEVRPPPTLVPRHLPRLDAETLGRAAITHAALRAGVEVERPTPETPRIVSSAHGALRHLLLCYPGYAGGEDVYRDVFVDLFRQLPTSVDLTVLAHASVVGELQHSLEEARGEAETTIVEAPEYLHYTVWAEDPYVVVDDVATDPPRSFLVEPFTFPRAGDSIVAELIAEASEIQSIQSPLYFQGGNILVADDRVLIGVDYLYETLETLTRYHPVLGLPDDPGQARDFVVDLFRKTFDPERDFFFVGTRLPVPDVQSRPVTINGEQWTEVLYAGTGYHQPIFHIDMLVSLTGRGSSGRYRVLVGSPAEADRILGRSPLPQALSEIFDDVARELEAQGFEVIRNPLPLTYVDDPQARERFWYFATSNNCLVQIDEAQGDHVWLPTYGHGAWSELAATDDANRLVWEGLGFTVHQLADFNVFAQNLGSVHCIKKYLARD
jgi:hypothetical protein